MAGPIPVSSLVAVLMICIGIGLFCGTGYVGCSLVHQAFTESKDAYTYTAPMTEAPTTTAASPSDENDQFLEKLERVVSPVQISILCLSGFMVLEIVYSLFQAFMATATIISTDYSKHSLVCGDKCWTAVSVVSSYLLTFLWVLVLLGAFYCFLITYMLYSNRDSDTINWKTYGLKGGVLDFSDSTESKREPFNESIEQAYVMFAIFPGAALIVLLGMINLTMCHSANLAHLRTASYWREYYARRAEDQMELSSYTNHGAVQSTNEVNLNMYQ